MVAKVTQPHVTLRGPTARRFQELHSTMFSSFSATEFNRAVERVVNDVLLDQVERSLFLTHLKENLEFNRAQKNRRTELHRGTAK